VLNIISAAINTFFSFILPYYIMYICLVEVVLYT